VQTWKNKPMKLFWLSLHNEVDEALYLFSCFSLYCLLLVHQLSELNFSVQVVTSVKMLYNLLTFHYSFVT